jgi:hypothetical protein
VTFDAPDAALAVSLLDVDHDHHLDVVVSAPITRTVVRIWLNDGHGRFRETMPRPSSNARVDDADAAASHTAPDEAPPTTAPRPAPPSLSPASHRLAIGDDSRRMPTIDRRCPRLLAASHAASRGPPRG